MNKLNIFLTILNASILFLGYYWTKGLSCAYWIGASAMVLVILLNIFIRENK